MTEQKPEFKPRQPDYHLWCLNKSNNAKGKVGAGWQNDDGSIRIVLEPFIVLTAAPSLMLTLFKAGTYKPKTEPASESSSEEPASTRGIPEDEIPF